MTPQVAADPSTATSTAQPSRLEDAGLTDNEGPRCYRIVRTRQVGAQSSHTYTTRRTIKRGLTLAEAQAHCRSEKTHGPGWFDGYEVAR